MPYVDCFLTCDLSCTPARGRQKTHQCVRHDNAPFNSLLTLTVTICGSTGSMPRCILSSRLSKRCVTWRASLKAPFLNCSSRVFQWLVHRICQSNHLKPGSPRSILFAHLLISYSPMFLLQTIWYRRYKHADLPWIRGEKRTRSSQNRKSRREYGSCTDRDGLWWWSITVQETALVGICWSSLLINGIILWRAFLVVHSWWS